MPNEPSTAAKEIASFVAHRTRGTTFGMHLRAYHGEMWIAEAIQELVNKGLLKGQVVTGDHDEDGKVVYDWEELAPGSSQFSTEEGSKLMAFADALQANAGLCDLAGIEYLRSLAVRMQG